jgi:hypothetical protein
MSEMTTEEKKEFGFMKKQIFDVNTKVDKILVALVGDDIAKEGGMVRKIQLLEDEVEKVTRGYVELQSNYNKLERKIDIYKVIIIALAVGFGLGAGAKYMGILKDFL